ncbi:soluble inorganic pyrophosphatase 6, chloroplastic-like [Magnolia sinica]|uniref:soluble inorganic pyrophosphatase 6, chloroplastic-like n=1 Tax=Magnolia sinica TaxID=86752 RepID=UPI002659D4F5|nr:soluble inorganic pyrophosphatase 6, chloroplastic-like [Magnolia sinica]
MIDKGELDWKIVAISLDDPRASLVNDVADVEKHFPGTLTSIRDWFRDYKIPDGKPANKFGLGNKAASKNVKVHIQLLYVMILRTQLCPPIMCKVCATLQKSGWS